MPTRHRTSSLATPRAMIANGREFHALARVAIYFVVTRLLVFGVVWAAIRIEGSPLHGRTIRYLGDNAWLGGFLRDDAWWYVSIVERGYVYDAKGASNIPFLPLFPVVVALFSKLFGNPALAGLFVSNLNSILAVFVFFHWVRERVGSQAAERATLFLLLYPFSFFFHSAYAESTYFLICTLALREADRARWLPAGIWASLASLTRPIGILLVPAFALSIASAWRVSRRLNPSTLALLLPIASVLGLFGYMWAKFGDPFLIVKAQEAGWKTHAMWNVVAHYRATLMPTAGRNALAFQLLDVVHVLLPLPFAALALVAWRRLGPGPGSYAFLVIGLAVLYGLESMGRELLAAVPAFAAGGVIPYRLSVAALTALGMLALLLLFAHAFAARQFMG